MTGFSVDEDALANISANLRRQADYCQEAKSFLNKHADYEHSEGIINALNGASESVHENVDGWFKTATVECFTTAADRIDDALAYYRATDESSAADFDAAIDLDGSGDELVLAPGSVSNDFTDKVVPLDALREPGDYRSHPEYEYSPTALDVFSTAGIARSTVHHATSILASLGIGNGPHDPYESWVRPITGDWGQVKANSEVMTSLGSFTLQIADNIHAVRVQTAEVWTGNAAGLFDEYMSRLESAFTTSEPTFNALAKAFDQSAEYMVETRKKAVFTFELIIDTAFAVLAAAKVAAVTLLTPVGLVSAGALTALGAVLAKRITSLITLYQASQLEIDTNASFIESLGRVGGGNESLPVLPLPSDAGSAMTHLPE